MGEGALYSWLQSYKVRHSERPIRYGMASSAHEGKSPRGRVAVNYGGRTAQRRNRLSPTLTVCGSCLVDLHVTLGEMSSRKAVVSYRQGRAPRFWQGRFTRKEEEGRKEQAIFGRKAQEERKPITTEIGGRQISASR